MALPKIFTKRRGRSIRVKRSQPPHPDNSLPKRRSLVRMASVFGSSATKVAAASTPIMTSASATMVMADTPPDVDAPAECVPDDTTSTDPGKSAFESTPTTDSAPSHTASPIPPPPSVPAFIATPGRTARTNSAWAINARMNGPRARDPIARLDPATLRAVRETLDGTQNGTSSSASLHDPTLDPAAETLPTLKPIPTDLSNPAIHQSQSLFCVHLPAEIRLLIFASLLNVKLDSGARLSIPLSSARVSPEPYILSCRQVYYETMDLYRKAYWTRNTFILDKTYLTPWAVSVRPADLSKIQRFSVQVPGRRILVEMEEGMWVARETDACRGNVGQMYLACVRRGLRSVNARRELVEERGATNRGGFTLEDLTTMMGITWLK